MKSTFHRFFKKLNISTCLILVATGMYLTLTFFTANAQHLLQVPLSRDHYQQNRRSEQIQTSLLQDMMFRSHANESMFLAQVNSIQRIPLRSFEREQKQLTPKQLAMFKETMTQLQSVKSGRFQVLDTLAGLPARGEIEVINQPLDNSHPSPFANKLRATEVLRQGEYWIVFYDNQSHQVNKEDSFWLTGPNDPILIAYRHHQIWMKSQNSSAALQEIEVITQDSKLPTMVRIGALLSLRAYSHALGISQSEIDKRQIVLSRIVTHILIMPEALHYLHMQAIKSTNIDLTHEIAPDSDEALQLHALLQTVELNSDPAMVDEAANRLYFVLIQQPRGPQNSIYYCPEILQALEQRETLDYTMGHPSFVSRTLANLKLAGRGRLKDIDKRTTNLIIRNLPPIRNRSIANNILAASRK